MTDVEPAGHFGVGVFDMTMDCSDELGRWMVLASVLAAACGVKTVGNLDGGSDSGDSSAEGSDGHSSVGSHSGSGESGSDSTTSGTVSATVGSFTDSGTDGTETDTPPASARPATARSAIRSPSSRPRTQLVHRRQPGVRGRARRCRLLGHRLPDDDTTMTIGCSARRKSSPRTRSWCRTTRSRR